MMNKVIKIPFKWMIQNLIQIITKLKKQNQKLLCLLTFKEYKWNLNKLDKALFRLKEVQKIL